MRNLKKTLAVVLAFAMILSMGLTSMAAYSDVEAGTVVSEAVGILSNLNILTGFEDGTFKPDETVTRAQMAAIICRTLGYEDQAKSSAGSTVFNDVAADHWASGYINVAQAQQIINGYGDGNYGPEDKVTYEQAVKMIVSALGYDLAANAKGGYPTGYLAIASAEGITKNANGRVGDAAKRGTIAVLVYNSLEVRLMNIWSTDGTDEYGKQNANILSKYLEVTKYEGVVASTPVTAGANQAYDPTSKQVISLSGAEYWKFQSTAPYLYEKVAVGGSGTLSSINCELIPDVEKYLGKKVVAYIGEDDVYGDRTVFAIAEAKNQNESIVITADQLVDSTYTSDYGVVGQVSYKKEGSSRVTDISMQMDATTTTNTSVKVYVNYELQNSGTPVANVSTSYVDGNVTAGKIEFISNDYDSDIEVILITDYDEEAVIEDVLVEDGVYMFECYNSGAASINEIDPENEQEKVIVYVDGEIADASALKAGYTVSTVEISNDAKFRVLYASSKSVTGAVESYSSAEGIVTIAGEDYELSPKSGLVIADVKDQEGIFFLNVDGKIAHNDTHAVGNANYGFALVVGQDSGLNTPYVISVVSTDGTAVDYELKDNAQFISKTGTTLTSTAAATAEYVADIMSDGTADNETITINATTKKSATAAHAEKLVFQFTTRDGKITRVKELEGSTNNYKTNTSGGNTKYDAEAMTLGAAQFDESTVVFNLDKYTSTSADLKSDNVTVGNVSTFFADGDAFDFVALDVEKDVAPIVVGFKLSPSIPKDAAAMVVTSVKTVSYDDDTAVLVGGVQAGELVEYIIYSENTYTTNPATLAKGDIILVAKADSEGVASDCKRLYSAEAKAIDINDQSTTDKIYNAYGELDKVNTTNSKFFIDVNVANGGGTLYNAIDGIPAKNSANYTLVDYTENLSTPTVSKKNAGTSLFSKRDEYVSKVFVRVYDDKLAEVVVMRYAANGVVENPVVNSVTGEVNGVVEYKVSELATAAITCGTTGATIEYSINGADWSTTQPAAGDVGKTVKVRATKTEAGKTWIPSGIVAGKIIAG